MTQVLISTHQSAVQRVICPAHPARFRGGNPPYTTWPIPHGYIRKRVVTTSNSRAVRAAVKPSDEPLRKAKPLNIKVPALSLIPPQVVETPIHHDMFPRDATSQLTRSLSATC